MMHDVQDASEITAPFRELIERTLKENYGQINYQDVVDGINEGEYQFWTAENSCVMTTIDIFPRMKQLTVVIGAGDLEEIDNVIRKKYSDFIVDTQVRCAAAARAARPCP